MDASILLGLVIIPLGLYSLYVTMILLRAKQRRKTRLALAASATQAKRKNAFTASTDETSRLEQALGKFIPNQFMRHFDDLTGLAPKLGHAVQEDIAIMFCDIRGFTGMSERLAPNDLIQFLNSYFLRMNGPIHKNNGFIDKFIGDAIMALFDHPGGNSSDKAQDAIKAAIAMQKAVRLYNEHRKNSNYNPIEVGIGVHYGSVTVGTVGSNERMDTTVIGDNVNVAAKLESLSKKYSAGVLISEEAYQAAGDNFAINVRVLDIVRIKGRMRPVKIYEVLDHLLEEQQIYKRQTHDLLEQGLNLRMRKQWKVAMSIFQQALQLTPDDPLVVHHIEMCHRCQKMTLPDEWEGAISVAS